MKKTNTNNDDDNWLDRWAKNKKIDEKLCVFDISIIIDSNLSIMYGIYQWISKKKIHLDNIYNNDKEKSILEQILQDKLFV